MFAMNSIAIRSQYLDVLNGCRKKNRIVINESLQSLVWSAKKQYPVPEDLLQLYSLCLMYLRINKTAEIEWIFDRLLHVRTAKPLEDAFRISAKAHMDVAIENANEETVYLKTTDPVIAERLQNLGAVVPGTMKHISPNCLAWSLTVLKQALPSVLKQLKTPQYLNFLNKTASKQLAFDF